MRPLASELTVCMWQIDHALDGVIDLLPLHFVSPSWVNHGSILSSLGYVLGMYEVLLSAGHLTNELAAPVMDEVNDLIGFIEDYFYDYVGW